MRMRQLECFVRTCELGSISRAAEQLHVAQPALGLQIRNLEQDFGVALLVRSSRGVSPTPAGEILLEWARDVLQRTRQVKDRLRAATAVEVAHLSLALTPSTMAILAAPILAQIGDRYPNLNLRVLEGLSHVVVDWIDAEKVDLALISGMSERRSLSQMPVMREQLYFVTAAEPKGPDGPIQLAEVLGAQLAMPGESDALRIIVENDARSIESPLTLKYEVSSISAIKDLVGRRLASTILPFSAVRREVRTGEFTARLIVDPPISRTLVLVRRCHREMNTHERQVFSVILDCLRSLLHEDSRLSPYELLEARGVLSPTG